ncbi:MAG: HNH endonuclease [Armatimonadota bacterium]
MLARVGRLSDLDLLAQVKDLAQREREATVALIAHLAELDQRRLYLAEGYPSLFKYCTDVLHLSEHATYNRIETARTVRQFPVLLEHLAAGWVTLFAIRLLAPHLTLENHRSVLALARHKSKREIEELIARLRPQPPVPDVIRKLPTRTQAASKSPLPVGAQDAPGTARGDDAFETMPAVAPSAMPAPAVPPTPPAARRAAVSPLAPERYKVQFTASAALHTKLREAQALLRHQIPDGDLEKIFDRALEALLANLRKQKLAATARPRGNRKQASGAEPNSLPSSRHIPAAVRRAVWARDGGCCAFASTNGRRCAEEGFLEFHHVVPYASGGPSTVDNIELRCRAHNGYEAERHVRRWGTAAAREEPAVYAPGAWAVGVAAVPGDRPTNSFRNEFRSDGLERKRRGRKPTSTKLLLVGPGGLEPPTSPLSGARSHHLS